MASTALQNYISTLSGLVAYWPLEDAAGVTNPVDLGPNNLALTKTTSPTMGAAQAVVDGGGTSFNVTGSGGYLQRTVTAGTPLQLSSAVTIGGFYRPTTIAATQRVFGRDANWETRLSSAGAVLGRVVVGGAATQTVASNTDGAISINNNWLIVTTYDGKEIKSYIDGQVVSESVSVGTITTTTDLFTIGQVGSTFANGYIGHVFVLNRAIGLGVMRLMLELGKVSALGAGSRFGDYEDDATPSVADTSDAGDRCALCGRKMRVGESRVRPSSGPGLYHAGCSAFRGRSRSVAVLTSGSTKDQVINHTQRLIWDTKERWTERVSSTDSVYFDTALNRYVGSSGTTFRRSQTGLSTATAIMAYYEDLPKSSWHIAQAVAQIDDYITQQNANGSFTTGGNVESHWPLFEIGQSLLFLRDKLSTAKYSSWLNTCIKIADYMLYGSTVPSGLSSTTLWARPAAGVADSTFYVNGNYEAGLAPICYWVMYHLTGFQRYLDALLYQFGKAESPNSSEVSNAPSPGLVVTRPATSELSYLGPSLPVTGVASTDVITSVGHGYANGDPICFLALTGGTGLSVDTMYFVRDVTTDTFKVAKNMDLSVAGSAGVPSTFVPSTALDFTTDITAGTVARYATGYFQEKGTGAYGEDFNYSTFTLALVLRFWQLSGHPKGRYWANLIHNQLWPRIDQGTGSGAQTGPALGSGAWVIDQRGGTRVNQLTRWSPSSHQVLNWAGIRPDVTGQQIASSFESLRSEFDSNYLVASNTNEAVYRTMGLDIASRLMAAPDWPGTPQGFATSIPTVPSGGQTSGVALYDRGLYNVNLYG